MRRSDQGFFPHMLCAAIIMAGAAGVAAGNQLQNRNASPAAHAAAFSFTLVADAAAQDQTQPAYRFIDGKDLTPVQPADVDAPKFSRIVIEKSGVSHLEGDGTPGSQVLIRSGGRMIGGAVADEQGRWTVALEKNLTAGDHVITSFAAGVQTTQPGDEVRIFIPSDFSGREIVAYDRARETGSLASDRAILRRAQELAAAASEKFTEIVPVKPELPAEPPASPPPAKGIGAGIDIATPIEGWLDKAAKAYRDHVAAKLSVPSSSGPDAGVAQNEPHAEPSAAADSSVATPADGPSNDMLSSGAAAVRDWMKAASESYDREIATPLSVPTGDEGAPATGAQLKAAETKPAIEWPVIKAPRPHVDTSGAPAEAARKIQLERERAAKAQRDADERERASAVAAYGRDAEELKRRQREEAALKARDAERVAVDKARKDAEAKKLVEGMKRLEAAQRAEEDRRAAAEARTKSEPDMLPSKREAIRDRESAEAGASEGPSRQLEFTVEGEDDDAGPAARKAESKRSRQALVDDRRTNVSSRKRKGSRVGGWTKREKACRGGFQKSRSGRRLVYVVKPGDSLWAIANKLYRRGSRYNIIYRANRDRLPSADLIRPCQKLILPSRGKK